MSHPTDDLIRMLVPKVELRDGDGDGMPTLSGHFAVFNKWTEIDSWEGRFLERVAPGAFKKTIRENRDSLKVLYDHGMDPQLGNKPLGPIATLREDAKGAFYEVPLIDTDYNRDFIIPAAREGLLGASFRFRVDRESWEDQDTATPKRTLEAVRLYEFGPVTFPAYEAATAGVRSKADMALWNRLDASGRAELIRLMTVGAVEDPGAGETTPDEEEEPADATPFLTKAKIEMERMAELWRPQ